MNVRESRSPSRLLRGLSVVIPAHNSAELIGPTVEALRRYLTGMNAEIVVVENGSSDDTYARCEEIQRTWDDAGTKFRLIRSPAGMGRALRAGILASRGRLLLLTADDLPFAFDDLEGYVHAGELAKPTAVLAAIGSKAHPDSFVERSWARRIFTRAFAVLRRIALGMRTGDTQGTYIIDGALARSVIPLVIEDGFLFTTELALVLERRGIFPIEVPVRLAPAHGQHASRVSARHAVGMALGILRLGYRHAVWRRKDQSAAHR